MTETRQEPDRHPSPPDLLEHGAPKAGVPQTLDSRLFVQLQVFTNCFNTETLVEAIKGSGLNSVLYADVNDPRGVGLLTMSVDPDVFTGPARALMASAPFDRLTHRPELTMLGRTYAIGREADLEDFLLKRTLRNTLNPSHRWAVWYPLRRIGAFNRLSRDEQGKMMLEHAMIGRSYGEAGYAHDIRLECHGLDRDDNEFVIGLVSSTLHPLSRLVKDMRRTRQTSEFIEKMGPFFIGRVAWQSPLPAAAVAAPGTGY